MCLIVHLEPGPLLADVGFGRPSTSRSRSRPASARPTPAAASCSARPGAACSSWCTTACAQNRIQPAARSLADFADGCDYQQTSPDSIFTRNPVCTIRSAGGRTTLSGLQLIETSDSGLREERAVGRSAYGDILAARFGIRLSEPEIERLADVAARAASAL